MVAGGEGSRRNSRNLLILLQGKYANAASEVTIQEDQIAKAFPAVVGTHPRIVLI